MDSETKVALRHTKRHCRDCRILQHRPKEFANYQKNLRKKRAVERNIESIGEALNRILKRDKSVIITNSRKIIDTRNRIIHGYDSVSDDVIWGVMIRHLPILRVEIEILLDERKL